MKRSLILILVMALMLSLLCPFVSASEITPEHTMVLASYWKDDVLYSFVKPANADADSLRCVLSAKDMLPMETQAVPANEVGAVVHYMLLIDASTSMAKHRQDVRNLATALMKSERNVEISIATFDRGFRVHASNLTTRRKVEMALNTISYDRDGSDISGGAAAALKELGNAGYDQCKMTNLVVITDGEPWYTNNENREQDLENEANQKFAATKAAYPEILVHTYCFGEWDADAYAALSIGQGIHATGNDPAHIGTTLAEFFDSLYVASFSLPGYEDVATIVDSLRINVDRSVYEISPVRNVDLIPEVGEYVPEETKPEETQPEETQPEETKPEETQPEETQPEETRPEETMDESTESMEIVTDPTGDDEIIELPDEPDKKFPWWLVAIGGVLLIAVVALILLKKMRQPRDVVPMRLEVISGNVNALKKVYYLDREIMIGTSKKSDIVIPGDEMTQVTARIYRRDQMIYVETVSSGGEVRLNGMRLMSSNRLRSGDELTVGMVTLRALF